MIKHEQTPSGEANTQEIVRLLELVKQQAILRKEKERIDRVLEHFIYTGKQQLH